MKIIHLSQNKKTIIDDEDYGFLNKWKWCINDNGYAVTNIGHGRGNRTIRRMHRFIIKVPKGKFIDHINRDRLDNRRCNLRICDKSQNSANRPKSSRNITGYKGVHLFKRTGKFQVQIKKGIDRYNVGYFDTAAEAALAYNRKAIELFGKFAFINKI